MPQVQVDRVSDYIVSVDPAPAADRAVYALVRGGCEFMCEMPPGFDERTKIAVAPFGGIYAAHPDHPPMYFNQSTKLWEQLDYGAPTRASSIRSS